MRDLTLAFAGERSTRKTTNVSTKTLNLILLGAIILSSLVYLFNINLLSTQGYEIRKLEQEIRQLENAQKTLQLQSSELQSISRVESQAQQLNLVPVSNVTYLKNSDFALK